MFAYGTSRFLCEETSLSDEYQDANRDNLREMLAFFDVKEVEEDFSSDNERIAEEANKLNQCGNKHPYDDLIDRIENYLQSTLQKNI